MHKPLNIVVVEDHDALREVTVEALSQRGHHVRGVDSAEALPDEPGLLPIDLMVIDLNLPGEDGISLAARIRAASCVTVWLARALCVVHQRQIRYPGLHEFPRYDPRRAVA